MRVFFAITALFICSVAYAQLELSHGPAGILAAGTEVKKVGDRYLVRSAGPLSAISGELILADNAENVEFKVTNQSFEPVDYVKIPPNGIFISIPGRALVQADEYGEIELANGTKRFIRLDSKTIVVDVGSGPNPPGPGPTPPVPPTPDVVPNKYGLGTVAFSNAPHDATTLATYAKIYQQAGDFLFGVPTLKFIVSENDQHSTDPNRSVMAWIDQQSSQVQCTDQQVCQQWSVWRSAMSQALRDSQNARQYTRQDWYNAFGEISQALRAVK